MRSLILKTMLALPLLVSTTIAKDSYFAGLPGEVYGYSSEDMLGGGGSYLGVDTRDITPDRLEPLQLKEERGVEVTMVDQDAPAGKAGIKEHDVIMSINGSPVESVEQLRRVIREIPPGRVVNVGISRGGQTLSLKAQLADRKMAFTPGVPVKAFKFQMPAMPAIPEIDVPVSVVMVHSSGRSGLMVENLTPQLGAFFGTKDGQGVLVRSVEKGSRAEQAGFRAGDVIVKVNGEPVGDTGDFTHHLRARKEGSLSVVIVRDKKEQTITMTLPERKQSELEEESFEVPEIDAETRAQFAELKKEIARNRPQIIELTKEYKRIQPDLEEITKEAKERADEIREQMRELQQELRDQQEEMQDQLQDQVQDEFRFEFSGPKADI